MIVDDKDKWAPAKQDAVVDDLEGAVVPQGDDPDEQALDHPSFPPSHHLNAFRTIPHSTLISTQDDSRYDEECNICLTPFQVGDNAAWSMQYGKMVMNGGSSSSGLSNNNHCEAASSSANDVCKHVFHEECISRWLLVRDGCPKCRRSYFTAPATTASTMTAADSAPPENEVNDVEQGANNVSVIEGYESD